MILEVKDHPAPEYTEQEMATLKEALANRPTATGFVVSKSLKEIVQKLIEDAPNLSAVQNNPWLYTEWLARLNGVVLNS